MTSKKKFAIEFAPNAEKNLQEIEDFISEQSDSKTAVKVIDGILSVCESLQLMPRLGQPRKDILPGMRSITSGNFVVYYRIGDCIEILRVWHASRDSQALKQELK